MDRADGRPADYLRPAGAVVTLTHWKVLGAVVALVVVALLLWWQWQAAAVAAGTVAAAAMTARRSGAAARAAEAVAEERESAQREAVADAMEPRDGDTEVSRAERLARLGDPSRRG